MNVKMSRVSRFLTQIIRQSLAISLAVLSNKRDACKKKSFKLLQGFIQFFATHRSGLLLNFGLIFIYQFCNFR